MLVSLMIVLFNVFVSFAIMYYMLQKTKIRRRLKRYHADERKEYLVSLLQTTRKQQNNA